MTRTLLEVVLCLLVAGASLGLAIIIGYFAAVGFVIVMFGRVLGC